jgi:UDP-N-acetylmuramoyl-tripeptide--D-alanyl-D-alanine ligase
MEQISMLDLLGATGGRLLQHGADNVTGVTTDSRHVQNGDLFVAIKGDRFDGHHYASDAVQVGAKAVVLSDSRFAPDTGAVILVRDTRQALGDVAAFHRQRLVVRVAAVTGSNGKTTVRGMLAAILRPRSRVLEAEGNFNNDIGVPLTLLRLTPETEVAVLEIEMNEPGGTRRLADISRPEVGAITNVGDSHLESMHDRQGVAREKAELLEALSDTGTAVVNADDELVMEMARRFGHSKQVTFGTLVKADVFACDIVDHGLDGSEFLLQGEHRVRVRLPGLHNVANCLAAAAAARALGIGFDMMPDPLAAFEPQPMRLVVKRLGDITVLDDCYNANPQSMRAAMEVLCASVEKGRRVAFLGDMLELGERAVEFHTAIGRRVVGCLDRVVFVGPLGGHAAAVAIRDGMGADRVRVYSESEQVLPELFDMIRAGDRILVKGSRTIRMELIAQALEEKYGG